MSTMVHKLMRASGWPVNYSIPSLPPPPTPPPAGGAAKHVAVGRISFKRRMQAYVHSVVQLVRTYRLPSFITGVYMRVALAVAVVVLIIAYLMQLTTASANGYKLHEFENQVAVLERENNNLRVEVATHQSLARIEGRVSSLPLVPVTQVPYTPWEVSGVVARR